tara:strand:+ start:102265 stop:102372 length:108 start_codon:yes stop_codon:yes gene_type:complete
VEARCGGYFTVRFCGVRGGHSGVAHGGEGQPCLGD